MIIGPPPKFHGTRDILSCTTEASCQTADGGDRVEARSPPSAGAPVTARCRVLRSACLPPSVEAHFLEQGRESRAPRDWADLVGVTLVLDLQDRFASTNEGLQCVALVVLVTLFVDGEIVATDEGSSLVDVVLEPN